VGALFRWSDNATPGEKAVSKLSRSRDLRAVRLKGRLTHAGEWVASTTSLIRDLRKIEKSSGEHDIKTDLTEEVDDEVSRIVDQDLRSVFIGTEDDLANDLVSSALRDTTQLEGEIDSAVETEIEVDEVAMEDLEVAIELAA
jgi:hypothetical protein